MKKYLLGIGTGAGYGTPRNEEIPILADIGFDACFTGWKAGDPVAEWAKLIKECGMIYQSIHAPFNKMNVIWDEGEAGDAAVEELILCLHDCAENNIGIMVAHPIIGMDKHTPTPLGIERFAKLLRAAEGTGVKVAFENVEGIEYLQAIIKELGDHSSIGYCWDTGHEMCYNFSMDVPALFGGKLIATHLNDNMGQTDPEKKVVTWLDDSHLMPFDGVADWQGIADRLDRVDFDGVMTFELTSKSKPGKHTHDIYSALDYRGYMTEAFARAKKLAALRKQ